MPYSEILHVPQPGRHFCQLHRNGETLDAALRVYVIAGLRKEEVVVVFSNEKRLQMIRECVMKAGLAPDELESRGQLLLKNGSAVLDTFLGKGAADWNGFRQTIERTLKDTLESVKRYGWSGVRAYGDMVNELWRANRIDETVQLEKLWNVVLQDQGVPLFCGYEFDSLDPEAYKSPVYKIACVHDEIATTQNDAVSVHALDRACVEIVGFSLAAISRHRFPASRSEPSMPRLQQVVMWLERNLPMHTAEVLQRARDLHAGVAGQASS